MIVLLFSEGESDVSDAVLIVLIKIRHKSGIFCSRSRRFDLASFVHAPGGLILLQASLPVV